MSEENSKEYFEKKFEKVYEEKSPDFDAHVNVALVGKVSSGKSSLLNAFFYCSREDIIANVGASSGVTTKITPYKLDKNVLIIDCPGLDDIRKENSEETEKFIKSIDFGIFVVTGSADASQKRNFDDLRKNSENAIVVLNKIDEWDDLENSAYEEVLSQWKSVLGVDRIFGTCTKGFDPKTRKSAPMDIRGVDDVRKEVFNFLDGKGKAILLARHLKSKETYAIRIIVTAIVAAAGAALVPGGAAIITAAQVIAIESLNYLYKGEVLSKASILSILPAFAGQSLGGTLFLWAKSFLPPTFILEVAAVGVAVVITFAMLATVNWMLRNEYSLSDKAALTSAFLKFKEIGSELKGLKIDELMNKDIISSLLSRLLKGA